MQFDPSNVMHYIYAIAVVVAAKYVGSLYIQVADKYDPLADVRLLFGTPERDSPEVRRRQPKMWIHVAHDRNARIWQSFGSPSSRELNQAYITLCIASIVGHCGADFDIMMVDDTTFAKLIPDWPHGDMSSEIQPRANRLREIAMATLVYLNGGIIMPNTFVCAQPMLPVYEDYLASTEMFISKDPERPRRGREEDAYILGAKKSAPALLEFIEYMRKSVHDDVARSEFEQRRRVTGWIASQIGVGRVAVLRGIGQHDAKGRDISVDRLFDDAPIALPQENYGLLLPGREILARRKFGWFAYLSEDDLLTRKFFVTRYLARVTHDLRFDA
jgi:hypothetical protein